MDHCIQVPLHLPEVRVLSSHGTAQGHWLIRVESPLEGTRWRRCGREIREWHGLDAVVRLRHRPVFDVPVFIEIRPTRYRGPACAGNPTTTPRCEGDEPRPPNTKAYGPWALRRVIHSTVADAARQLGLSEETIDGILLRADLTAWFARDSTKAGATCAMRAWCQRVRASGPAAFQRVLGTIDRWLAKSTNDFQGRPTSGFVEGCNTRVKVLKWRGYGIFHVDRLFQRLTLDRHGYQRFGHT